ncbi:hypothetical protein [Sphingomonas pituitosa]|uniref:hypothetical protein n=1 Tax=Sphingomonas pituitosa TaxID=99597 RepID=UPI00082E1664|nr:hypothetical protein [Sphingomonas pituitosa]
MTPTLADSLEAGAVERRGMLPAVTYFSCIICHGTGEAFGGECTSCTDPDIGVARFVLERLTVEQMAFLRAYGHTLAYQPVTRSEERAHSCEYWVEADDGEWSEDRMNWIIPPTRHWFGSGMSKSGPGGGAYFIKYNPLGLVLRECLSAGAGACLPHYTRAHATEEQRHA